MLFSITKRNNGSFLLQWRKDEHSLRKTISLGKCTKEFAEFVLYSLKRGEKKIEGLPEKTERKLADAGFLPAVPSRNLDNFLNDFIQKYSVKKSPHSIRNMETAMQLITTHFAGRSVASITTEDADNWYAWRARSVATTTLNRDVRRIKQIFEKAVEYEMIDKNPFRFLKGGSSINPDRFEFVDRDRIDRVLDACDCQQWRTIIALARFGGIRVHSELIALRWENVDFDGEKRKDRTPNLVVPNCKTKRRMMPLFPELRRELKNEVGRTGYVVHQCRVKSNLDKGLKRIIEKSGVKPWKILWHNLRASRQSELESEGHSTTAVCSWMGNSASVAKDHYLRPLDADFAKAV